MPEFWELVPSRSSSKSIERFPARPDPYTGDYGPVYIYDDAPPIETCSVVARNLSRAEADDELARVRTKDTSYTYTMADGSTVTGIPTRYSDRLQETQDLEVTIEIHRTDV